ncbi:MAG: hypothetical protein M5U28_36365 [Sandaracinaceae bacterium]|nr:hypothetical protein [Sandaracinaceae bacterium]
MVARRFWSEAGRLSSKAPNIDAAMAMRNAASGNTNHGLESCEPKTPPVSPATTPTGVKSAHIPSTYIVERPAPCSLLLAWLAPNTLTVMAIIG